MKTDLFQSCGHCWVFQICWHIEYSTFTASSFRIWNSSTGSPSPPLALFIVMLSKAHLTSHSRMSGSTWVITPSWLSGSWRSFLYSSSVHSCHLFLIPSASVRSAPFLSFIEPHLLTSFCCYGLVINLCLTLCSWDFPSRNSGVSCHFLLQGNFPTQESNLCLLPEISAMKKYCKWKFLSLDSLEESETWIKLTKGELVFLNGFHSGKLRQI